MLEEADDDIEALRIHIRHLRNDYELTRREYEDAARNYLDTLTAVQHQKAELEDANRRLREANLELKESIERADELACQAQQANQAKGRFLMQMSHEIRTPMNAVLGMADLIDEGPLQPEQREFLGMLKTAGNHLLGIIDDILDYSKLQSNSLRLAEEPFDLHRTAEQCVRLVSIKTMGKPLEVTWQVGSGVPRFILGDELRLRQVLINLMGNAVKFTEAGHVALRIDLEPEGRLCLAVHDSGIGIPQEHLSLIFQRFYQSDQSLARSYGGTGLGLAITRDLIELMNGDIQVESQVGQGSVFRVRIPLRPAPGVPAKKEVAAVPEPVVAERAGPILLPPIRILHAEDMEVNRNLVRLFLRWQPVELVEVGNGRLAVEEFKRNRYDLILMDVEMPEMDGLAAMRQIRSLERELGMPAVTILALTAHAMNEQTDECRQAGADQVITKPVRKNRLLQAIAGGAHALACAEAPPPSSGGGALDMGRLVHEFDGDRDLAVSILRSWIESVPAQWLQMQGALEAGEWETVRRTAHAMKGTAANLCADSLSHAAAELEDAARRADATACRNVAVCFETTLLALQACAARHLTDSTPDATDT